MKKILVLILFLLQFCSIVIVSAATNNCWDITKSSLENSDISQMLRDCKPDWVLETKTNNEIANLWWVVSISTSSNDGYKIENAKQKILYITKNAVILASILAIWWIVYAWFMFVTDYGKWEKVKKAKDALKWSLIGFAIAIVAQQLVNAVINLIYWISG